ncbi:MAG: hypothetical protein AB7O24_33055 [Kofleriaceae bacterium]
MAVRFDLEHRTIVGTLGDRGSGGRRHAGMSLGANLDEVTVTGIALDDELHGFEIVVMADQRHA